MNRTIRVDFHCHSNLSDGYFSPEALAHKMSEAKVRFAALTDHGALAGVDRFQRAASRLGIVTISGMEVFALFRGREIHLLAYGLSPTSSVTPRLSAKNLPADEAIPLIHLAGGRVFLAHPLDAHSDPDMLREEFAELHGMGLDGIEAWYGPYSMEQRRMLADLARERGLLRSAGSDFHGPSPTGSPAIGVEMPSSDWREFRDRMAALSDPHKLQASPESADQAGAGVNMRGFLFRIVLPAALAVVFYTAYLFLILIPGEERALLSRKREMIQELTNSAWSILDEYHTEVVEGRRTLEQARRDAIERVKFMRYGKESKDYFWITDMTPRMIMHPWREDLDGQYLGDITDPDGTPLFREFVRVVRESGEGFVDYVWQWKDDPENLEPKESYVRGFEPWGWIIGTGMYIQDVRGEIRAITGRIIDISVIISLAVGGLLLIVTHQSFRIERRRGEAERALRVSHEKYRVLAESAAEGALMIMDHRCAHANKAFLEMLGCGEDELSMLDIHDLFPSEGEVPNPAVAMLDDKLEGRLALRQFEASIRRTNGNFLRVLISPTRVYHAGRKGLMLNVRDLARQQFLEREMDASHRKYEILAERLDIGLFRVVADSRGTFVELNDAGRRVLGWPENRPVSSGLFEHFEIREDAESIRRELESEGAVVARVVRVRRRDGLAVVLVLSLATASRDGGAEFFDGIMRDETHQMDISETRDQMLGRLQSVFAFLHEPAEKWARGLVECPWNASIARAAEIMTKRRAEILAIHDADRRIVGTVSDGDLRERVLAEGLDTSRGVSSVMTAPVPSIPADAPIFGALFHMRQNGRQSVALRDAARDIKGMLFASDLSAHMWSCGEARLQEIERAASVPELAEIERSLVSMVASLVEAGTSPENIGRSITAVADAVARRVVELCVQELGPPPVPFVFVALGSQGRQEMTLLGDQDNAIIYADGGRDGSVDPADYFLKLGEDVCRDLDQIGYDYCTGNVMARNPKWNQPLSQWKKTFTDWIAIPVDEKLLRFNIFFDLRPIYGAEELATELRGHIHETLAQCPSFFPHFARNTLHYKPPIGLFGQIVTGGERADPESFNIKDAALPIINFVRLYTLKNGIDATHTMDRLKLLRRADVLRDDTHRELREAWRHLMRLRFQNQVHAIREGRKPNNSINPKALTQIDASIVKQAFSQIAAIQKKVGFDFLGGA